MQPRNRLDVFIPRKAWARKGPRPVVIFITGGAWTIGYKGALFLRGSGGSRNASQEQWEGALMLSCGKIKTPDALACPAAWGALLGRRLSQRGCLVFCLDYRNFPQVGGAFVREIAWEGVDVALLLRTWKTKGCCLAGVPC